MPPVIASIAKDGLPARILIADDHAVVRQGLRGLLTQEFPQVKIHEAMDSRAAVECLLQGDWDLVLLDLNMPGRGGFDVLEEARRLRPHTPVLVLSAYAEEEFAVRAFKLGAAGYLNKQCVPDELIAAVKKITAGGKYVTATQAERMAVLFGGQIQQAPHEALSTRELQVLQLIARDRTLKEIAVELDLTEKTVATYRARIAEKTGLHSKIEISRYAFENKLVG